MIESAFFDTNVLVYMHDRRLPEKRAVARELFERYFSQRKGILSTQVIQEFFVSITGKAARLPVPQAKELVTDYLRLNVVVVRPAHILDAIDLQTRFQISFWDGLILAAAKLAGASILFSEDFSHGRIYDGIRVENPFRSTRGSLSAQ